MTALSTHEVTQLLIAWSDGDEAALEKLTPLVYAELHQLAQRYMSHERESHTLQTSALINEAYLRLIDWKNVRWQNRAHFVGVAAQLMRKILVDHARNRGRLKRGGAAIKAPLDEAMIISNEPTADLIALDEALNRLATLDERKSRIVELRFFGGMSVDETAVILGTSPRSVAREWNLSKAWLYLELSGEKMDDA